MSASIAVVAGVFDSFGAVWESDILRRALLEAAVVGAIGGAIGIHISLRRMAFTTMALTHATFPGIVLAAVLGVNLLAGSAIFGLALVLALAALGRVRQLDTSTTTGVLLAGGFALGVLLLSAQDGFAKDLTSFLVGSILTTTNAELAVTVIGGAVLALVLAVFSKELIFSAFDPVGAEAQGFSLGRLDLIVLLALEATLVLTIPSVGTLLSVSLLVGPATIARLWTDHLRRAMVIAPLIGAAFAMAGIVISHAADTAAGATIAVIIGLGFAVSLGLTSAPVRRFFGQLPRSRHHELRPAHEQPTTSPSARPVSPGKVSRHGLGRRAAQETELVR